MFIGVYKHKVLVVDDDPLMASVLGELMCAHGYDVNVMNSAIEAISEIEKEIPSLIISDINMPDMDGYEFCRTIRGRFMDKVIPIILVTGGYSIEERLLGLEAGADDFLIKPFRTKEILLRASALVRTRELHDSLLLQNQRVHGQGRDLEKRVLDQEFQLAQLKKFFSPKVAELVSVSTDQGLKTSHRKELTLLFTDLRGFTSFTERAGPGEVIQVLHEYYSLIGNHALEHQGTLGRFLGDGMMVYFNDPNEVANHQRVAMNTALAMRESLLRLREKWLESRYELDVGIGIATGIETVGLIGFDKCQDYSIIGTATNFASRLCAEAKGGQILVSDTFFKVHLAQDFNSEFLGEVSFKGIQAPVKIHNITGSKVAQEMHPA